MVQERGEEQEELREIRVQEKGEEQKERARRKGGVVRERGEEQEELRGIGGKTGTGGRSGTTDGALEEG